jgi:hypothetical protein
MQFLRSAQRATSRKNRMMSEGIVASAHKLRGMLRLDTEAAFWKERGVERIKVVLTVKLRRVV